MEEGEGRPTDRTKELRDGRRRTGERTILQRGQGLEIGAKCVIFEEVYNFFRYLTPTLYLGMT